MTLRTMLHHALRIHSFGNNLIITMSRKLITEINYEVPASTHNTWNDLDPIVYIVSVEETSSILKIGFFSVKKTLFK